MLIDINKIKVSDRIRKDFGDIEELANDIKDNGLINPPTVTPEFELIAGERRLRACKFLEYPQIEVRVMAVEDEEHQLKLEISENENRKEFSYSERMDWAKRLERIERIKAEKRMKSTQFGDVTAKENFPEPSSEGQTRDFVGKQSGFGSGKQYEKAKFIHENADEEVIEQLDKEEISIHKAWLETKARLEAEVEEEKRKREEAEGKVVHVERELEELKNKPSEVKEVEVVPDDILEELEKYKNDSKKLQEYREKHGSNKELERKEKELSDNIFELEKGYGELMRSYDMATLRTRLVNSVSVPFEELEKRKTEMEQLMSMDIELDNLTINILRSKADTLKEVANTIYSYLGVVEDQEEKNERIDVIDVIDVT